MARPSVSNPRVHDATVFRIEQSILQELEVKQRNLLDTAARLVAQRLKPVDPREAKIFLNEIRVGALL